MSSVHHQAFLKSVVFFLSFLCYVVVHKNCGVLGWTPTTLPNCSSQYNRCNFQDCACDDDACQIMDIFPHTTQLPTLKPTARYLYIRLNLVTGCDVRHSFPNVENITHLSINNTNPNCWWSWLPNWLAQPFSNLVCLDLSGDDATDYEFMRSEALSIPTLLFYNATNTVTTLPNLNPSFSSDPKINLPNSSNVREITLNGSPVLRRPFPVKYPTWTGFCSLKSLQVLRMDKCGLSEVPSLLCKLPTLVELSLNDNNMEVFPETVDNDSQSFFPSLKRLYLRNNRFSFLSKETFLPKMTVLDLSGNALTLLETDKQETDEMVIYHGTPFPMLNTLIFEKQTNLRPVDKAVWSKTFFSRLHELCKPLRLKTLSLANSGKDFSSEQEVSKEIFYPVKHLHTLIVDRNNFGMVTSRRFLQVFGRLSKLKTLSLNKCNLRKMSMKVFEHFQGLEALSLRETRISQTLLPDGTFDGLPGLRDLDLSGNELSSVGENTFGYHLRDRLVSLDLSENNLVCDCDLLWFVGWVARNGGKMKGSLEQYECDNTAPPQRLLTDFSKPQQACLLSPQTSGMIVFACSVIITTLTVVSLLFRYRWHLRLLLYEAFRGRDDGARRQRLLQNNFDYDVFVSYASEDLTWVQRQLMPELEYRLGLKLCIHERDFTLGRNIVDNIADCVESSKKMIMVFSKDFVLSQWCQFELTYCLRHVMDYDDALIIMCVDDVVSREMTTAMMAVLKMTTYIQWEERGYAVDAFWGRVRLALAEIMENDHVV